MIKRLVIFGAAGDLTARYLLPGIAALPDGFELTCSGREDWDGGRYRDWASAQLARHTGELWPDVLRSVRPLTEESVRTRTRRARYTAGRVGDRAVPAYVDEAGVDPASR